MKIEILGNGGAFDKVSTSYLINEEILVDCGDNVIHKYLHTDKLKKVKHLFITHTHNDHIGGFETLFFYLAIIVNKNWDDINLTVYGSEDVLKYYKASACSNCQDKKEYRQPFNFVNVDMKTSSIKIGDIFVENVPALHMNGSLKCHSFIFNDIKRDKRCIITGDTDSVNPLISKSLMDKGNTLLFHDVGWTGLPLLENGEHYHPTEQMVYDFYGKNKNIIGIHTSNELEYYEFAEIGKIYNW